MAEDLAIGKSLVIPQDVLNKIDEVDKKINQIATDSEKMAEKYSSAIKKMSLNSDSLLKKLTDMQTKNNIDVSKFAQGVSNVSKGTIQIEKFATAISKAAATINKYNSNKLNQKNIDNTKEINNLKKEIDALKKKTEQLERYRQKQREVNQEQNSTRINTKAIDAYNRAMASSEALVTQRINKIAKLRQAEEMLTQSGGKYESQIKRIRSEIERLNKLNQGQVDAYGKIIKSHNNLMNTSDQLMRKLALIFSVSQIQGYLMNMVKVRGEFELQNTALASILQNKDQADKLFAQITELAVKSPFTLKELTTYTKSLSAYQVEYEKLYDTTKMLADVSAGLGVDMQRLILAFGQVKAANFLRGTEVRQFTEAGFNILGELSKYYSELEGRMVSVGEVQDRVTRKMVDFADVENIFKRVTAAGGIFYNMQERQAETLAGQMSNLQDSIDIMFNEIGKSNEGTIKTLVSSVKTIVENWQVFASLLKAVSAGFAVYTARVILASAANNKFAKSSIAATASQKGLVGILGKTIKSFQSIGTFAKSNPFTLIASAVAFLGSQLYSHYENVEENRKAYDTLINSIQTTKDELSEISSRINEQNNNIQEYNDYLDKLEKGTDLYAEAEAKANREREKQSVNLEELKSKFPEVYKGITQQEDGIVNLANAVERYNNALEKTNYLIYLSKKTETFFSDGLEVNINDAIKAQNEYKSKIDNVNFAWKELNAKLKEFYSTNKYVDERIKEELDGIANSSSNVSDKIIQMYNTMLLQRGINTGGLKRIISNFTDDARDAKEATEDLSDAQKALAKNIESVAQSYVSSEDLTTEEGRRNAQISLQELMKNLDIKDEAIRKFVQQEFELRIGVKLDFKDEEGDALGIIEKRINDYLESNKFYIIPQIQEGRSSTEFFQQLKSKYDDLKKEAEQIGRATQQLYPNQTNIERLEEVNKEMSQIKTTLKDWGYLEEKKNKEQKSNPEIQRLKEQISLIQKAGNEYNKLRQYYSKENAKKMVENAYGDAFEDLNLSITMDFDTSGMIDAMNNLTDKTGKRWSENFTEIGKKAQKEINEATAQLETKKQIEITVKGIEEIQNQIDGIFKNYEFSLELQSAGIDPDAFKDMLKNLGASDAEISLVGLDATTFEESAKKVRDIISDLQKDGGEKNLELARKYQEQITQLEVKEARKRFDELYKLREKYQSNEEKILKAQSSLNTDKNELAVLEAMKASGVEVNKEQEELLKLRIKAGEDAILQLKSEALQLTDFWQKLFGDLNDISVNSLVDLSRITEEIISNRKEIRGDNGETKGYSSSYTDKDGIKRQVTLTQQQYQRLLKQNNQVADEVRKKNPFLALYQAMIKGKNEGETQLDYYTRLEGILSDVSNAAFQTAGNLLDIFGANDEAKEMLNSIKGIADGAVNLGMGVAKITSGDIIGGGMSAISGIASIVTSITKIGDKKKEREIERQIELVEELQHKYENLEDAINSAYSLDTLSAGTKQMNENLKEQNKALEKSIAAEEDKKDTDSNRIKDYQKQIEANQNQIEENNKALIESLGGFGTDDSVKSAAEEFAQSWLDAYLEVGNGLDGLQEKMDDWINNAIQKQILTQLSSKYITPILEEFDRMFTEGSIGGQIMTGEELAAWQKLYETKSEQFNEAAEAYIEALKQAGINIGGTSGEGMSGLSQSIQGITEGQADALSAITESIRYFASDSNTVLRNIYNCIINPPVESPLFAEMKLQTQQLRLMYSLWNSMSTTKGGVAGRVMKVQMV